MEHFKNIREYYKPIQPLEKKVGNSVRYSEVVPNINLLPYIYCYWELTSTKPLTEPFSYRVVSDGCIDIFFELSQPEENYVMGFCKKFTEFNLGNNFHYIGVRFLPTMFPQMFNVNASTLSNQFQALSNISKNAALFINANFNLNMHLNSIASVFDAFFLDLVKKIEFNEDSRLYEAIFQIFKNQGVLKIESDIKTGLSARQLRRLFNYYIGDSAKTFSKVVRFQNILSAKPSKQSLKLNKLFYNVGYYDQAHFIKDFNNFYGLTPSEAFGR